MKFLIKDPNLDPWFPLKKATEKERQEWGPHINTQGKTNSQKAPVFFWVPAVGFSGCMANIYETIFVLKKPTILLGD